MPTRPDAVNEHDNDGNCDNDGNDEYNDDSSPCSPSSSDDYSESSFDDCGEQPVGNEYAISSLQGINLILCLIFLWCVPNGSMGRLPPQTLSKGVPLKDAYRIHPNDLGGDTRDGFIYSGFEVKSKINVETGMRTSLRIIFNLS